LLKLAMDPRGDTHSHHVIREMLNDNRTGSHHGVRANVDTVKHNRPKPQV
jgi:hypothetical protein